MVQSVFLRTLVEIEMIPVNFPSLIDVMEGNPVPNNMFQVNVGITSFGLFTKVSGLGYTIEPYEIAEGGRNNSIHQKPFKQPGKWEEVELEWGAVKKQMMEAWIQFVSPGYPFRRNVFISHVNRQGAIQRIYVLLGAWPKTVEGRRTQFYGQRCGDGVAHLGLRTHYNHIDVTCHP